MIIYLLDNLVNGKVYIGQTIEPLAVRWRKHRSSARKGAQTRIAKAIRKYGEKSFKVVEVGKAESRDHLNEMEVAVIDLFESTNPDKGYNITAGGDSVHITPLGIEKMRKSLTGKKRSPEVCEKLRVSMLKRWADPEYKKAVSAKISRGLLGKKRSEAHNRNMGLAHRGITPKWKNPKDRAEKIKLSWAVRKQKESIYVPA